MTDEKLPPAERDAIRSLVERGVPPPPNDWLRLLAALDASEAENLRLRQDANIDWRATLARAEAAETLLAEAVELLRTTTQTQTSATSHRRDLDAARAFLARVGSVTPGVEQQ